METERVADAHREQENETAQIPPRISRENSLDRQSRGYSPERDIQSQISNLASEVKETVMSLSDTMQIRFERFNERLGDMQRNISDLQNRNTNNGMGRNSVFSFPLSNTLENQSEATHRSANSRESGHTKVKPQLYDGLTDIDEYLTQFSIIAEINKWSCDTKALHLASCLTGSARSLLSELDSVHRRNFTSLVSALQNRFGTANRAEVYRAQLKNRVRQRNETIPELAQNIRKLTRQAYPGANSDLIDTLALDHFIDSLLDSETRLRLRECSPKTIQEAETLAVKLEAQRLADRQRSKNVGSLSETSEDRNFSNDMRKLSETVNGLVESVEHLQKKREPTDFQPRNEHGNGTNSPNSYRSPRPNQNFDNRNRLGNGNRPRNWSRNGQNDQYFARQPARRNYGQNDQNFARQPAHRNFNGRPMGQQNDASRSQQPGNGNRSSLGIAARPWRM